MKEIEGHYYVCEVCGCFYKIINGAQIRQPMSNLKFINDYNFHAAQDHKQHLGNLNIMKHGDTRKKVKDKNMGLYSIKKMVDNKNDKQ